jgi:ribose 5-phosphate isomerase B
MRIAIASDHRGVKMKGYIIELLKKLDYEYKDFGTDTEDSVDYPDFARDVALDIRAKKYDYGILICGTGIGMCIAANKVRGIRAAVCRTVFEAHRARAHNNINILCLGADSPEIDNIDDIVKEFINTPFEAGRHQRRLDIISTMENL